MVSCFLKMLDDTFLEKRSSHLNSELFNIVSYAVLRYLASISTGAHCPK